MGSRRGVRFPASSLWTVRRIGCPQLIFFPREPRIGWKIDRGLFSSEFQYLRAQQLLKPNFASPCRFTHLYITVNFHLLSFQCFFLSGVGKVKKRIWLLRLHKSCYSCWAIIFITYLSGHINISMYLFVAQRYVQKARIDRFVIDFDNTWQHLVAGTFILFATYIRLSCSRIVQKVWNMWPTKWWLSGATRWW